MQELPPGWDEATPLEDVAGEQVWGGSRDDIDGRVDVVKADESSVFMVRILSADGRDDRDYAGIFQAYPTDDEAVDVARKLMVTVTDLVDSDEQSDVHPLAVATNTHSGCHIPASDSSAIGSEAERYLEGVQLVKGEPPAYFSIVEGGFITDSVSRTPAVFVVAVGSPRQGFTPCGVFRTGHADVDSVKDAVDVLADSGLDLPAGGDSPGEVAVLATALLVSETTRDGQQALVLRDVVEKERDALQRISGRVE